MNKLDHLNNALSDSLEIESVSETLIKKAYECLQATVSSLAEQQAYKQHTTFSAMHGEEKAKKEDIWGKTELKINEKLDFGIKEVIAVAQLMLEIEKVRADDGHRIDHLRHVS